MSDDRRLATRGSDAPAPGVPRVLQEIRRRPGQTSNKQGTAEWMLSEHLESKFAYQPGSFWLGRSEINEDGTGGVPLGVPPTDDRHVCLVSATRGGKGTSIIVNNLCMWPGSIVVIDPKGENATVTAARRGAGSLHSDGMGQRVFVVDPFRSATVAEELRGGFNPIDEIDPTAENAINKAGRIASSLILVDTKGDSKFFDGSARMLLKGIILHVASSPLYEGRRNLVTVRRLLVIGDWEGEEALLQDSLEREDGPKEVPTGHELLFCDMAHSKACFGQVSDIGRRFRTAAEHGPKSFESILMTAVEATSFIDEPEMQRSLSRSDFKLADVKTDPKGISIYLSLPDTFMPTHAGWLRMIVTLLIGEMEAVKHKPACGHRVLLCLDEFTTLKRIDVIEQATQKLAGFGLKILFAVQGFPQLYDAYDKNWETMVGCSGVQIYFGLDENMTTEYVSKKIGDTEIVRYAQTQSQGGSNGQSIARSQNHSEAQGESLGTSHGASRSLTTSDSTSESSGRTHGHSLSDGISRGISTGDSKGVSKGVSEGTSTGTSEGTSAGVSLGTSNARSKGISKGVSEGTSIGTSEGTSAGVSHGKSIGVSDGISVGRSEGITSGLSEGTSAGTSYGSSDGVSHGTSTGHTTSTGSHTGSSHSVNFSPGGLFTRPRVQGFSEGTSSGDSWGTSDSSNDSTTRSTSTSKTDSLTNSKTHSSSTSATDSLTASSTRSVTDSTTQSHTNSFTRSNTNSTTRSLTDSETQSTNESLTHSLTGSQTRSANDSTTHSLTDSETRSTTHSTTKNSGTAENWGENESITNQSGRSRADGLSLTESNSQNSSITDGYSDTATATAGSSYTEGLNEQFQKRRLIAPDEIIRDFSRIDDPSHPAFPGAALVLMSGMPAAIQRKNYFDDPYFYRKFDPHPDHRFNPPYADILTWLLHYKQVEEEQRLAAEAARLRREEAVRRAKEIIETRLARAHRRAIAGVLRTESKARKLAEELRHQAEERERIERERLEAEAEERYWAEVKIRLAAEEAERIEKKRIEAEEEERRQAEIRAREAAEEAERQKAAEEERRRVERERWEARLAKQLKEEEDRKRAEAEARQRAEEAERQRVAEEARQKAAEIERLKQQRIREEAERQEAERQHQAYLELVAAEKRARIIKWSVFSILVVVALIFGGPPVIHAIHRGFLAISHVVENTWLNLVSGANWLGTRPGRLAAKIRLDGQPKFPDISFAELLKGWPAKVLALMCIAVIIFGGRCVVMADFSYRKQAGFAVICFGAFALIGNLLIEYACIFISKFGFSALELRASCVLVALVGICAGAVVASIKRLMNRLAWVREVLAGL